MDLTIATTVLVSGVLITFIVAAVFILIVIKKFSGHRSFGGLYDAIKEADTIQMTTPKTLSGTEPVYRNMVLKDFPEFNLELARSYIKGFLPEYFHAKSTGSVSGIRDNCSAQFCDSLQSQLDSKKLSGQPFERYESVRVHNAVISGYTKNGYEAAITFEAAVEYALNGKLSQHKYKILYSYFLSYGARGENESLKCSNCGAPISTLGEKVCVYCGEAIEASVERTWKITDVIMVV